MMIMVFLLHFRNKYNINSFGDIMAIGIYDSGIGGLTVYKAVAAYFKKQDLIYLGDVEECLTATVQKKLLSVTV